MISSKEVSIGASDLPRKKKRVWPLNLLSALLCVFSLSLSSPDPFSQALSGVSLVIALGSAYFSVRMRFNWVALLLLLATAYFETFHLIFLFKR
jgi:hypothetical protein